MAERKENVSYAQAAKQSMPQAEHQQHSGTDNENLQANLVLGSVEQNSGEAGFPKDAGLQNRSKGTEDENYAATLRRGDIKSVELGSLRDDDAKLDSDADKGGKGRSKSPRRSRGVGGDQKPGALALTLHVGLGVVAASVVAVWVWKSGTEGGAGGMEAVRRLDKTRLAIGLTGLSLLYGGQWCAHKNLAKKD